ncbi:hypothetical protein F5880DRAFT_510473 [Lentinula raphanica]|nr:hypothetical protein F5880DRAFT_510473 [Lentinula raphanica]
MSWMIYDVQYHIDETYIGHIMTNDGTKLFWSVDSADSSVRLRQIDDFCINSMPKFHFVPITPREGQYLNKFQRRNHRVVHGGQPPAMENGGGSNLAVILEAIFTLIIINFNVEDGGFQRSSPTEMMMHMYRTPIIFKFVVSSFLLIPIPQHTRYQGA